MHSADQGTAGATALRSAWQCGIAQSYAMGLLAAVALKEPDNLSNLLVCEEQVSFAGPTLAVSSAL